MPNDTHDPGGRTADYWRQLAQQALIEAELTMDPHVHEVLMTLANEYLTLAEKLAARDMPERAG
jgi:hypothetical protein